MKELHVGEHTILVDDQDYEGVSQYSWYIQKGGRNYYAVTKIFGRTGLMHRMLICAPRGKMVDHIDGNGLNNQRANLRLCTLGENLRNSRPKRTRNKTSKFKGIWFIKNGRCRRCWRAAITAYGIRRNLGCFATEEAAARKYDEFARLLHGSFARPNFPSPSERAPAPACGAGRAAAAEYASCRTANCSNPGACHRRKRVGGATRTATTDDKTIASRRHHRRNQRLQR